MCPCTTGRCLKWSARASGGVAFPGTQGPVRSRESSGVDPSEELAIEIGEIEIRTPSGTGTAAPIAIEGTDDCKQGWILGTF